jgi:hypothetical protein
MPWNLRCRAPVCDARRAIARLRIPKRGRFASLLVGKRKSAFTGIVAGPAMDAQRAFNAHVNQYLGASGTE